jgi:hypothetical protein
MMEFCQAEGFLYDVRRIGTQPVSPVHGGLLQGSIRHVMGNILSSA